MKYIKWLIASIVVVVLLIFTAIFVVNAYNTGKIGNRTKRSPPILPRIFRECGRTHRPAR